MQSASLREHEKDRVRSPLVEEGGKRCTELTDINDELQQSSLNPPNTRRYAHATLQTLQLQTPSPHINFDLIR